MNADQILVELDKHMKDTFRERAEASVQFDDWAHNQAQGIGTMLAFLSGLSEGRYGMPADEVNAVTVKFPVSPQGVKQ